MQSSGAGNIGIEDATQLHANDHGMKSILEMDNLTDFLQKAELANREFSSEREQFLVVDNVAQQVVTQPQRDDGSRKKVQWDESVLYDSSDDDDDYDYDERQTKQQQKQREIDLATANAFEFHELAVPRRPKWDKSTTPAQLDQNEKEAFLQWRRAIAIKEETIMASASASHQSNQMNVSVTPFEKNIQVWRQLWRVLERSDIIVLVVDGRNPLFYLSLDLRKYVEQELNKSLIVVVNKCDYLTEKQRLMWHDYFRSFGADNNDNNGGGGLEHVFFSAVKEQEILDDVAKYGEGATGITTGTNTNNQDANQSNIMDKIPEEEQLTNEEMKQNDHPTTNSTVLDSKDIGIKNPLTRKELLDILCKYANLKGIQKNGHKTNDSNSSNPSNSPTNTRLEFGMVGFPNVGKSSVLNVLVGASKNNHKTSRVGVASQPGKTKHFQTLNVPDYNNITLCDCPGLVFPSFVSSHADLVLAGVYPLAQVRDYWPSVDLICKRIPREILEAHLGIQLPRPSVLDVAQRKGGGGGSDIVLEAPTGEELLKSYCIARSLLAASSGIPDYHKASRVVLRDYACGNLLYCHCPPMPDTVVVVDGEEEKKKKVMSEKKWEDEFHRETLLTAIRREKKLQDKFGQAILDADKGVDETTTTEQNTTTTTQNDDSIDVDLDIFDIISGGGDELGDNGRSKENSGKRGKKHKSIQKWGKKGRKTRNKDPYGCHSEPDETLFGVKGGSGLIVNAGKYGSNNYTRPSRKGARNAVQ